MLLEILISKIIFINFRDCQVLSIALNSVGLDNVCLHGFMRQKERVAALNRFKSNIVRVLIATDVASRGLDIPNVQLVLNHRLPKFPNEYIHRVGRTARAGRTGQAISIFRFPRDLEFLAEIENLINTKLSEHKIDDRLVQRIFMEVSIAVHEAETKVDNNDFDERIQNYRRKKWISDGLDPDVQEAKWEKELKQRIKQHKANAKAEREKMKTQAPPRLALEDDRFKNLEVKKKKHFKIRPDVKNLKKHDERFKDRPNVSKQDQRFKKFHQKQGQKSGQGKLQTSSKKKLTKGS